MVKKSKQGSDKKAAPGASPFDSALAGSVKESAQQIWLAGLGAFSKAQEEGGKVFETLVKEGASLQRKTQSVAEEKLSEVSSRMSTMASEVTSRAGQQWDRLESIFEDRVSKAMGKLGVPSSKDVAALVRRIDELSGQVDRLTKAAAARPARKARAAKDTTATGAAPKSAGKRSAARKAV